MRICLLSILLCVFILNRSHTQVPQGIPYQAIARNGQGQPLANLSVKVRFSILDSTLTGTAVYSETHEPTTSAQGLFSANVGMGTSSLGTFSSINWGVNAKFLKVELDTTASGNNYVDLGTQQMMSVPYALHAGQTSNVAQGQSHFRNTLIFYQNDTFVVPPNVTKVYVEAWGGGAGGFGSNYISFLYDTNCTIDSYLEYVANYAFKGKDGCRESAIINVFPNERIFIGIGVGGTGTPVNSLCSITGYPMGGNTFFGNYLVAIGGWNSSLINGDTHYCGLYDYGLLSGLEEYNHNTDINLYFGHDGQIPGEGGWSAVGFLSGPGDPGFKKGGNGANGMVIVHY